MQIITVDEAQAGLNGMKNGQIIRSGRFIFGAPEEIRTPDPLVRSGTH